MTTNPFGGPTGARPVGITVDAQGNIYTVNALGNSVTKISADGETTGQFGGTTGQLPTGIAIDKSGNLFTANFDANTVTRIRPDGTTGQFGGTTGNNPNRIAIDRAGNVYTANFGDDTVTKISADGTSTTQFGGTTGPSSEAIAIDADGNVYTASSTEDTVTKISADGTSTIQFGGTTGNAPYGIAIDADGNVYTSNYNDQTVTRISADGTRTTQFGGSTGSGPSGIAIDAEGNVFTANDGADTVTRISADGTGTEQFGDATGSGPFGIAIDSLDNVFTANRFENTVTKITPTRYLSLGPTRFPRTEVGATSRLSVTVTNDGEAPLTFSAIKVRGRGVTVTGGSCAVGTALATGKTCTVALSWTPLAAGPLRSGLLKFFYEPDGPLLGERAEVFGYATYAETALKVQAAGKNKKLKVDRANKLVSSVRTDGKITRATAWCELKGNRLPRRVQKKLCTVNVTAPGSAGWLNAARKVSKKKLRIKVMPMCNTGLTVHAKVTAKKAGAPKATWTRKWRVDNTPPVKCRIRGTG